MQKYKSISTYKQVTDIQSAMTIRSLIKWSLNTSQIHLKLKNDIFVFIFFAHTDSFTIYSFPFARVVKKKSRAAHIYIVEKTKRLRDSQCSKYYKTPPPSSCSIYLMLTGCQTKRKKNSTVITSPSSQTCPVIGKSKHKKQKLPWHSL